jgi:hypothetical protein
MAALRLWVALACLVSGVASFALHPPPLLHPAKPLALGRAPPAVLSQEAGQEASPADADAEATEVAASPSEARAQSEPAKPAAKQGLDLVDGATILFGLYLVLNILGVAGPGSSGPQIPEILLPPK